MATRPIRVLVAKPGLDGHDRGAKIVVHALMEAGMEVIYTGLHQSIEQIVKAAVEEDVDVIGLSILSGAHLPFAEGLVAALPEETKESTLIIFGGNIPSPDIPVLEKIGIDKIFRTSSDLVQIADYIDKNVNR